VKLRYGRPEEVDMSPQRIALVAQLAEGWVRSGIHPSLVVLVIRRGVIVLHEAFGRFGPGPESPPLSCDTIFPLGSLTKPVTASAIMQLVEDGTVGLNRPVQDYVPEFAGIGKEQVMVHHLLTHTSGLNEDELDVHVATRTGIAPVLLEQAVARPTPQEYLEPRYDGPLSKPPGAEMSYCNMNFALLGEIVRRQSGESPAEFARERIFGPLGMLDTDYVLPDSREHRLVRRPPGTPFPFLSVRQTHTGGSAAGGVTSTALDMATFGQMFLNRGAYGGVQVLSSATVTEMTRNQIPGIGTTFFDGMYYPEASWGYGWGIHGNGKWKYFDGSLHSPRAFNHSGAGGVYLWVDPVYEIVGVYFSVLAHIIPPNDPKWCTDLFVNAVTAAALDT
jgi:CubicO group peptidase (beta-lactamase class C family)